MKKAMLWTTLCGILLCTGCGNGTAQSANQDTDRETVTLDWYVNYSWYTTAWGGNEVSDAITERTGISVNYIAPKGNEAEKLETLIASDTLPDLITLGWWEEQYQEMIEQGKVYALNELAEKYEPAFWEAADAEALECYTELDGNIYGYPNSFYSPKDLENHENIAANQNFLVRRDIYEALGSPDMSTPEGFMGAVRKAARMFPEVDGEPLIPIGADEFTEEGNNSFDLYLQSFLAIPYEKDGIYYERNTDPEYLAWLKVFRQLGEEGYLKNDIFIDKRSQLEEKLAKGRYFCLFYQNTDIEAQQKQLFCDHPERIYIAVDGPANSSGDDPVLPIPGLHGWTVTMISKNCKAPEKAIQFLTYMMGEEGQKLLYLGVEGSMYDMVDGKPVAKPEVLELLNQDRSAYDKKYGGDDTYWMLQNNVKQLEWEYNTGNPISQMKQWTYPYVTYTGQYDLVFEEDAKARSLYRTMRKIWGEVLPKLLLSGSEKEFDQILEDYLKECGEAGYEQFCELATEEYRINKEKLGIQE